MTNSSNPKILVDTSVWVNVAEYKNTQILLEAMPWGDSYVFNWTSRRYPRIPRPDETKATSDIAAFSSILESHKSDGLTLLSSPAIDFEIGQNRRNDIFDFLFSNEPVQKIGEKLPRDAEWFLANSRYKPSLLEKYLKSHLFYESFKKSALPRQMMVDAFHYYEASNNGVAYYITIDYKFLKSIRRSKWSTGSCETLSPTELASRMNLKASNKDWNQTINNIFRQQRLVYAGTIYAPRNPLKFLKRLISRTPIKTPAHDKRFNPTSVQMLQAIRNYKNSQKSR